MPLYAESHPNFVITENSLGDFYTRPMLGNCNYWLRSPGSQPNCASMIDFVGQIGLIGTVNHELPIRPAMFISIDGKQKAVQKTSSKVLTSKASTKSVPPKSNTISEKELLEKSKPIVEQYYHKKINQNDVLKLLKEGSISVNGTWEATGEKTCLLSIAVENKDRELVDYLLKNGCDVNTETYTTEKRHGFRISHHPITTAITYHALDIAEQLLKFGADIRTPVKMNQTIIQTISMVSSIGDSETIEWLIKHGISPNTESDSYGGFKTVPIYDAVISGKYENVKVLLRAGADPDYIIRADTADFTSLNWAIMNNDMTSFNLLMDAHADPNCRRVSHQGGGDNPALCDAISEGRTAMAERLIRAGADVNCAITINGRRISAMQCAMYNGDFRLISLLQSHGAR